MKTLILGRLRIDLIINVVAIVFAGLEVLVGIVTIIRFATGA